MCGIIFQFIVYIINFVLLILGLLITGLGVLVHFKPEMAFPQFDNGIDIIGKFADASVIEETLYQFRDYTAPLAYGLILVGGILLLISIIAFAALFCCKSFFLILYIVIVSLLATGQAILGVLYLTKPDILATMTEKIVNRLVPAYKGYRDNSPPSVMLDSIQIFVQCCGAKSGEEFKEHPDWKRTYDNNGTNIDLVYPVSCCKSDNKTLLPVDDCPANFTNPDNNYITEGCSTKMISYLKDNLGTTIAFCVLAAAGGEFGLAILVLIYKYCSNERKPESKQKVVQPEKPKKRKQTK